MENKSLETKIVYKWWWVWDFEKEEEWLNRMAMQGWVLESVGFCRFTFRYSEPGEYIIRMEMRGPDDAYLHFMEEIGVEYIGRMVKWVYFRKKRELGEFRIFSDLDSKLQFLNRISRMLLIIGMANLVMGVVNSFSVSGMGVLNLLAGTLLMYGLGRIHVMIEVLKKERMLHE